MTKFYFYPEEGVFFIMLLRTRRLRFWQPGQSFLNKRPKFFLSMSKNDVNFFISKKVLVIKMVLWRRRIQFPQPHRNISIKNPKFLAQYPLKMKKIYFVQKTCFHSACSYGHAECCFYNVGKTFPTEGQKKTAQCPKKIERIYFFRKKTVKLSLWTSTMQFWRKRRKFLDERSEMFRSSSEKDETICFFSKKNYFSSKCFSGPKECSCGGPPKNLRQNTKKSSSNVRECLNFKNSSKK